MIYDFTFVVDADPHAKSAAGISFDREATSYKMAVFSAYQQIIGVSAQILRFEPDFLVSASNIADRSGLTRSAISLYMNGERRDGFPAPPCSPSIV